MAKQPAPGRTRSNDPEAMRGRVLDAAAEAFQSRGYHATSMHDVMHAAGVSGGALHHHYPTKKALALAVIRERVTQAVEQTWLEPIRAARTAADGILRVFGQISAGLDARKAVQGCPLGNLAIELSLADPDFRQAVGAVYQAWRRTIADKLRADQATGALRELDPEAFAGFVVASYSGAIALAKVEQATDPLRACARQLAAVLQSPGQRAGRRSAQRD